MFDLPKTTSVNKVIPKNTFDPYTNSNQRSLFSDKIVRIIWTNKIAFQNIHLQGNEVVEIQIFKIELKNKIIVRDILSIIDKSIPYHIIFWIEFEKEFYISTSVKHLNPNDQDLAVIDYTFSSDWKLINDHCYKLELKNNLDWVFKNFCDQLKSFDTDSKSIKELVQKQIKNDSLLKEIKKLKSEIARCKQFNKKVELNMRLKQLLGLF